MGGATEEGHTVAPGLPAALLQRLRQLAGLVQGVAGDAMGGSQRQLIHALGHGEEFLHGKRSIANGQLLKNAPTPVGDEHHQQVGATGLQLGAPQPTIAVVEQGQITAHQNGGSRGAGGHGQPRRQRQGAVNAGHPTETGDVVGTAGLGKAFPVPNGGTAGQEHRGGRLLIQPAGDGPGQPWLRDGGGLQLVVQPLL